MGREWLYKAGGGVGGGTSPSTTTTKPSVNRKTKREKNNSSSSSGCMSAIFKLFDIQNHQFRFHHPSFMSESAINNPQQSNVVDLQGVEAPRNSLQSPESMVEVASPPPPSPTKVKEQTNLNIPTGGIQIKTKRSRFTDDLSSECSSSPGTKTPNLVARLMGLDLLPEHSSPRPSSSSTPVNSHHRSRSLPVTPRISTASRRSTDNEYHHRLSLQIDKENCQEHESLQMKLARRRSEIPVNGKDDERTVQYAKQIANQVRERISRRLGTDITNTMSPATRNNEQRRDSNLVLFKPKKQPPSSAPAAKTKREDLVPFSSSPKLRLLDINNNLNKPILYSQSKPETATVNQTPLAKQGKLAAVRDKKCKKIASERYDLRLKKIHQQDEVFVNKISKKKKSTPLPNHVVNMTNTTKLLSFKKEMTSSSSTTRYLPQKQVSLMSMTQLPSSLNSSYNSNNTHKLNLSLQDSNPATSPSSTTSPLFSDQFSDDYISRIINHCGIHNTTPISTVQWYSLSHPLHPSIFHHLEKLCYPTATATATAGRRMIFELVDEFIVEILKTTYSSGMCGSELIGKLCEKIRSIPAAHCEVLEDIDGLIERDMRRSMRRLLSTALEAEAEEIVREIEGEIIETMVHEMVITLRVAPAGSDTLRSHVLFT